MSLLAVLHLVAVAGYAGFQWTVRVLVYPQFAGVGHGFVAYAAAHRARVTRVVGPLFLTQGVTTVWLLVRLLRGEAPAAPVLAGALCLAVVLGATALGAVPLHGRLDRGWDPGVHRRLLRVDTVRVVAATGQVLAAGWLVLG